MRVACTAVDVKIRGRGKETRVRYNNNNINTITIIILCRSYARAVPFPVYIILATWPIYYYNLYRVIVVHSHWPTNISVILALSAAQSPDLARPIRRDRTTPGDDAAATLNPYPAPILLHHLVIATSAAYFPCIPDHTSTDP